MNSMIVVVLLIALCGVNSLTFYISQTKERCFHDEYATNTVIIGSH